MLEKSFKIDITISSSVEDLGTLFRGLLSFSKKKALVNAKLLPLNKTAQSNPIFLTLKSFSSLRGIAIALLDSELDFVITVPCIYVQISSSRRNAKISLHLPYFQVHFGVSLGFTQENFYHYSFFAICDESQVLFVQLSHLVANLTPNGFGGDSLPCLKHKFVFVFTLDKEISFLDKAPEPSLFCPTPKLVLNFVYNFGCVSTLQLRFGIGLVFPYAGEDFDFGR